MQGICANPTGDLKINDIAKIAVEQANALIEELKKQCKSVNIKQILIMKFLVGTLCGGLMEDPKLYIQPPYLIIDAKSKGEAINRYNGKTHAHFFYGSVIARINNDKLEDISKYVSEKQAYDIYNEVIKNKL